MSNAVGDTRGILEFLPKRTNVMDLILFVSNKSTKY